MISNELKNLNEEIKKLEYFKTRKPLKEECLWSGKPHQLCFFIKQTFGLGIVVFIWYWLIDFTMVFPTQILLIFYIGYVIFSFFRMKTIKYFITEDEIIVKVWRTYEGCSRKVFELQKQRLNLLTPKQRFWFKQICFTTPVIKQSIFEKIFNVKTFQFKKDTNHKGSDSIQDIYEFTGSLKCIKDYEKVQSILKF